MYTPLVADGGASPPARPPAPAHPMPMPAPMVFTLPAHLGEAVHTAQGGAGGRAGHGTRGCKAYLYGSDLPPARPFTSFTLEHLLLRAQAMGLVRDRAGRFTKTYPRCAAGAELVDYMLWCRQAGSREQGVAIGNACIAAGLLVPVGVAPLPVPHGPSAVLASPGQLPTPFEDSHTALYSVLLRRRRSPLDGVLPEGTVSPASAYVLGLQGPPIDTTAAPTPAAAAAATAAPSPSTRAGTGEQPGAQGQQDSGPAEAMTPPAQPARPGKAGRRKEEEEGSVGADGAGRARGGAGGGEGSLPDLLPHTPLSPTSSKVGSLLRELQQEEEEEEEGAAESPLAPLTLHEDSVSVAQGSMGATGAHLAVLPDYTSASGVPLSVAHSVAESADLHLLQEGASGGGGVGGTGGGVLSPPSDGGAGVGVDSGGGVVEGGEGEGAVASERGEDEAAGEGGLDGGGTAGLASVPSTAPRARTISSGGAGMTSRFAGAVAFFRGKGAGGAGASAGGGAPSTAASRSGHHRPEDWLEAMEVGASSGSGPAAAPNPSSSASKPPLPLTRGASSKSVSIAKPRYPYPYPYQPEPAEPSAGAEGMGPSPAPPTAGLGAGQAGSVPSSVEGVGGLPASYSAGSALGAGQGQGGADGSAEAEGREAGSGTGGGGGGDGWRRGEKEALLALRTQLLGTVWREGWLVKEGHVVRNWKRRWFVLRGSSLAYYKAEPVPASGGGEASLGMLDIREYSLEKALGTGPRTSTSLRLCPKHDLGQEYVIDCVSNTDFVAWVKALGQAMGAWEGLSARAGRLEMARGGAEA